MPPQLDDRYAGHGASVAMVNPTGDDAERDLVYSEVNQGNAKANLTNSGSNVFNGLAIAIFLISLTAVEVAFLGAKASIHT